MGKPLSIIASIVVLVMLMPSFCFASIPILSNQYSAKKLTAEDGFVSSEIYSIIQDQQGMLWFGTAENGVMRYDGRKVTLFEFDSESVNGLSHNDAGNLMIDRNGIIWIGTWGGGANRYNPKTGKFENYYHDKNVPGSISANRIQSLYHDLDGTIWLGSYDNGLNKYIGPDNFEHVKKTENGNNGLSHNRVWDIENSDIDNLWVATSYGLNLYNKVEGTFEYFFPDPNNKTPTGANEIRHVLKSSQGNVYVGTQKGPFIFNSQDYSFSRIGFVNGQHLGQVNSIIEDHEGYIWFVTSRGVFRRDENSERLVQLDLEQNSGMRIIFEDSANTLWVTNELHGILKLVPHRKFKSIDNPELSAPNGIAADKHGDVLIANSASQLFKWDVSESTLKALFPPVFTKDNGFELNRLLERPVLLLDKNNIVWMAQDEGLVRFDLNTMQSTLISYPKSDPSYSEFREIRALSVDKDGHLWVGTYKNGVYIYNPKLNEFKHLGEEYGLSHPEVLTIYKDKSQNIWVGTGNGVNLWVDEAKGFKSFVNTKDSDNSLLGSIVQDIYETQNGYIWIATQQGLNLYKKDSNTFTHFNTQSGLPSSLIRSISDDEKGNLWLTTNKGITKLNPNTGKVTNFDSQNGLLGLNYYPSSLVKAQNNTLFTNSQRGIEYFSTLTTQTTIEEPELVLTGFNKMGVPVKLDTPYSYVENINISYLDYIFSFEFSVLDYLSPNKNIYAYKLEGYDDNWIEIGNRNTASFTNLDGGSYQFKVKATNSSGEWGEKVLSINVYVSPPPWKTWWAYSLYALFVVSGVVMVIYLRTKLQKAEIRRQKQFVVALEQQVSEKTASLETQARKLEGALKKAEEATRLKSEFLANMSHEIRTPMNGVIGMLDLLKCSGLTQEQSHSVNIASTSAHSLLSLINDILDFSKIEADKLELEFVDFDLREHLESLSESMALAAQEKGVSIVLDFSDIKEPMIQSDPGRIRQVVTNILSNAIKFTESGEIVLSASLDEDNNTGNCIFSCNVSDTGIGIPEEKLATLFDSFIQVDASTTRKYGGTGLGLSITKRLCQLLGGDVDVTSQVGIGSCFSIQCSVKKSHIENVINPDFSKLNITMLLVDPNTSSNNAIKKQLEFWGVSVLEALNADQALRILNKDSIDLILFNKTLTGLSGELMAKEIKSKASFKHIKLIMMTHLAEHFEAIHNSSVKLDGYFTKPTTKKDLLKALSTVTETLDSAAHVSKATVHNNTDKFINTFSKDTRILLVEDNKVNQIVALRTLDSLNLIVDVAENGLEALEKLKEVAAGSEYSIILMDCQMPIMDGYETTKNIRESNAGPQNSNIPIIAMTANAMQGDKQKCLDAGMDDYITKPIEANKVFEKLEYWYSKKNKPGN
ncbi:response regulator [Pseudoalteromonas luteoviolacea]|nr:response regulator [Pseudoalteromonas luteoviolacea]MBQ4908043.1 response regulator [Pseudoalteromonas luteoviolacea]